MLTIKNIQYLNNSWMKGSEIYYIHYKMATDEKYILNASKGGSGRGIIEIWIYRKHDGNLFLVDFIYEKETHTMGYLKESLTPHNLMNYIEKITNE